MDPGAGRYPNSFTCQDISLMERAARQDLTFPQLLSRNSPVPNARAGKSLPSHPILGLTQDGGQAQQCDYQQTASPSLAFMAPNQIWYPTTESGGCYLVTTGNSSSIGKMGASANPFMMGEFAQGVQCVDMGHPSRSGGASKFDSALQRQGSLEIYKQPSSIAPFVGEMDVHSQYQLSAWKDASSYIEKQASVLFKTPAQPVVEQVPRKPYQRPRVFCAGISGLFSGGELTMSELGILGVICSCHNMHMSVANFCEHAGHFPANPGNCVFMEGGESIVQWRKAFFSQFGVKVPEDHIGWHWTDYSGMQGENLSQKVTSRLGGCKEADFNQPRNFSVGMNNATLCSSVGFGLPNFSSHRNFGMTTYGDKNHTRVQNLAMMDPTIVDMPLKRSTGEEMRENLPVSQKAYNITTRNQRTNVTQFFLSNDTGPRVLAEQVSFAKLGAQPRCSNEDPIPFHEEKALEFYSGCYSSQNTEEVKKDLATSSFELKLGQPSQQNLSLGSVHSDSLHSKGSCGLSLAQVRPGTYQFPGQTERRPTSFDNLVHQGNVGTHNWHCSNEREFDMLQAGAEKLRNVQVQSCTFSDMQTLPMFSNLGNNPEAVAVSYHSDITMQSSVIRDSNERFRLGLPSSDYCTYVPLSVHPIDIAKDARNSSYSDQVPPLVVKPTVKSSEALRNVQGMFLIPPERPRPLMGPPEMTVATSEASIRQITAARSGACESSLSTWANQAPCFANSESFGSYDPAKLHECTEGAMLCVRADENRSQQGLPLHTEIRCDKERPSLCHVGPSKVNVCPDLLHSEESARDLKYQGVDNVDDSSRTPQDSYYMSTHNPCFSTGSGVRLTNEGETETDKPSRMAEQKSASQTAEEVCDLTELKKVQDPDKPTSRAHGQDVTFKELSSDPLILKHSCVEKVSLSNEGITKSAIDADADSTGIDVKSQDSPFPSKNLTGVERASFDSGLIKATRNSSGNVNCTTKQLVCNDVLDEGSGIGKCCSSIEADMEVMTNAGPVSSVVCVQALESQTSIANSSSSNAVISDTLSNSIQARKLFTEVENRRDATHAAAQGGSGGRSVQKSDKRGRKSPKWGVCHFVSSEEPECKEKLLPIEDRGVSRKRHHENSTFCVPTIKGLKRKRSALSGPDLTSLKMLTTFSKNSQEFRDKEYVLGVGSNVSLRPPKLAIVEQSKETRLINRENVFKPKRTKYHDLSSAYSKNPVSNLRKSLVSGKSKTLKLSGSCMKQGRGSLNRPEVKSVKTASLSSILEVPKEKSHSKVCNTRFNAPTNFVHSRLLHTKFRPAGDQTSRGNLDASPFGKGDMSTRNLSRPERGKRHREMVVRSSWQNKTCGPEKIVPAGKVALIAQALALEKEMVNVPLKFIPEKRLEPEALRKESRALLITIAECGSISAGLIERLQSQVTKTKLVQNSLLDTESKGLGSNDDVKIKPLKRRRNCRKRANFILNGKHILSVVCCICGEWSLQPNNVIVKCNGCGLGMHQACYGVTEVSKKPWICRPCKVHAINIVCVLCGYGGGAMTRAKKCGVLAKGLLEAWHHEGARIGGASNMASVFNRSSAPCKRECKNILSNSSFREDAMKDGQLGMSLEEFKVARNNVADGVNDPTVPQWVHVVCALWMPGTRCINLKTMAAFDVSGVARAARKSLCSICKRAGGACIKCRVPKCAMTFHPWCAHGKGLLQNEAFGDEEDKVGFFGKCLLHGNILKETLEEAPISESAPFVTTALVEATPNNYGTCARTEGCYKRGETSLGVMQEDVTAWLSRKENRRDSRRFIKLANSDMKTHYREYIRFKQEQGWKRLAVYKSSIHALGLYTSENIAKGEMVVEYVGEVIGLRVADKRETDYLSNGGLQYRGACYLFRIDEENIIDATLKGGIARFVNHSCSPNCVAKIISVEKQKKVVFFAERDIASGEELTYDYKLDFETENRLPCYCKSSACRGFLN